MHRVLFSLLAVVTVAWAACSEGPTEPIQIQPSVSSIRLDSLYAGPVSMAVETSHDLILFNGWLPKHPTCAGFSERAFLDGRTLDVDFRTVPKSGPNQVCEPAEENWYRFEAGFAVRGGREYHVRGTWLGRVLLDEELDVP